MDEFLSGKEMNALLVKGARIDGWLPSQAAVHLLVFTELPRTRQFQEDHVTVGTRWSLAAGESQRGAWVNDWAKLATDRKLYPADHERRFLALAASLAAGRKVDLDEACCNMGHAHARRIAEAILIRTGADRFYTLGGTAKLDELHAMHRELSGPTREEARQSMLADRADRERS